MIFTYETRTTKITYETKAESLERGYDYAGGILDDFADFLRGCGFPLDREDTLVLYNEDKEVILEQVELDAMREDLIELDILREGKTDEITDCDVKAEDGWIAWEGGPCPVPRDTRVEVQFADGHIFIAVAGAFRWEHDSTAGDIVAYRVVEEVE